MNNLAIKNGDGHNQVDDLLHDFFQAEMPHPWPSLKLPTEHAARRGSSSWSSFTGRVALAACIGLMIAGYLTVAAFFPVRQSATGVETIQQGIGSKEKHHGSPAHQHDQESPELFRD